MQESGFEKLKNKAEKENKIRKDLVLHKDFMLKELPPNKWVVKDLIPEGMTILSAAPGQFKTYILLALSKQISNGELGFNHFELEQRNVLFINEEMGEKSMQDRLKTLSGEAGEIYYTHLSGIKLEDMSVILEICKEKSITLVVFDSLTRIHDLSENDASDVKKIFEAMLILLREGISVVMTHHNRKAPTAGPKKGSDEMRGSTDLLAQIDCHLAIDAVSADKAYLVIKQLKLRQAENIPDFKVAIQKDRDAGKVEFVYRGEFSLGDAQNIKIEDHKYIVVAVIRENPGITKDGIFEKLDGKLGKMVIQNVLPRLEADGIIFSQTKRPKTYYIKEEILTIF